MLHPHLAFQVVKEFGPGDLGLRMETYRANLRPVLDQVCRDPGSGKLKFIILGDACYNNFLYRFVKSSHLYKILNISNLTRLSYS